MVALEAAGRRAPAQRRFVLRSGTMAAVGALASGTRMVFDPKGGWAMDAETLRPATLQTLVSAARDLHCDHDRPDADYARAVKALDVVAKTEPALRALMEAGVAQLDRLARQRFAKPYTAVAGEAARHAILRAMGTSAFLHRFKDELSGTLGRRGAPAAPVAINGAWPASDRWRGRDAEPGRGLVPAEESRAGV